VAGSRRLLAAVLLPLAVLVSACGSGSESLSGAVLDQQYVVPSTPLTDDDGAAYTLTGSTEKRLTLVFFGYTHCPDICQLVMSDIASALTRLEPAQQRKVDMLFVTSDPKRDTPQVLRDYLDRFNPSFEGLTGPLPRIVDVAHALGVPIEKGARLPSGGYEVAHGTQIVGVRADGTAPIVWTEGTSAAALAEDLTALLHRSR
jgi:protein SCO1/2